MNYLKDYERTVRKVNRGTCKVFNEWNQFALITKEEFLEALEWLFNDPLTEEGRPTRELGVELSRDMQNKILSETHPKFADEYDERKLKGHIVRLKRTYKEGTLWALYRADTGKIWTAGRWGESINCLSNL